MPLQYLSDYSGKHTAVVIPIKEWEALVDKYTDLQTLEYDARNGIPAPKKYTMSDFMGSISPEAAESLQTYTAKSRDEWDRNS